MKIANYLLLSGALVASLNSCSTGKPVIVKARVWNTAERPEFYPEQHDKEYKVGELGKVRKTPSSFGVAFSGGGTRAATAAIGQLRMLHELGWIDEVDYISAVSGGAWAAVPYTFLPDCHNDEDFLALNNYLPPQNFTDESIQRIKTTQFAYAIRDSSILKRLLKAWGALEGDGAYASVLNSIFLERFGLGETDKFFTWDALSAKAIEDASGPDGPTSNDFYTAREGRPYLLVGGTLQKKHKTFQINRLPSDVYPFVMTPHYSGVPTRMDVFAHDQFRIGGGYIESAGYDCRPPASLDLSCPDPLRVPLKVRSDRYRFTLSDVLAISGSAPQRIFTGGLRWVSLGLFSNLGLPELEHWPVLEHGADPFRDDVVHGDGGNLENTGLHMLLARGVRNIVVFVNTKEPFNSEIPGVTPGKLTAGQAHKINDEDRDNIASSIAVCFRRTQEKPYNKVFSDKEYAELFNAFAEIDEANKLAGNSGMTPLVHVSEYRVQRNHWHNIEPYVAKICWVYLYSPPGWQKQITDSSPICKSIREGKGKFSRFPYYNTFLTQGQYGQLIDLSREQVNALANLTSWTLEKAAAKIRRGFSPALKLP